ncbi:hypothetical protein ACTHGU_07800 [Chitinophagaceae bacterium MMS25-I14]
MRYTRVLSALAGCVACLLPSFSQAQSEFPRGLQRLQVGYSFLMGSATYKYDATTFDQSSVTLIDTTATEKIKSKGGFGVTIGTYFPISRLGNKGSLCIAVDGVWNALMWEKGGFSYSSNSETGTTSSGSGTMQFGLPVGFDYKFGCDGLLDKSKRFCFTVGTGVFPSANLTVFKGQTDNKMMVLPYIKGEVGVFAGICFKVRAQYSFGNLKYMEYNQSDDITTSTMSLKGKSNLAVSLILMPFSWKWEKDSWWR